MTFLGAWRRNKTEDIEGLTRLEKAEDDLRDLQERGDLAHRLLHERKCRNHWRETVQQMIQGVP